jgi:predicted membrane channel-forming protein YqfA (hemolysin III family)
MLTGWIGFAIWLALFATAGILVPRRPRLSGFAFLALGCWSVFLRSATLDQFPGWRAVVLLGVAAVWFVIGIRSLRLHSHP